MFESSIGFRLSKSLTSHVTSLTSCDVNGPNIIKPKEPINSNGTKRVLTELDICIYGILKKSHIYF